MVRTSTILLTILTIGSAHADSLPGTKPLETEGDLAARMVAGIDKYLMRELAKTQTKPNREQLRKSIGAVDQRLPITALEFVGTIGQSSLVAETEQYKVHAVRWPVFEGVDGEGLLLEPKGKVRANVIAIPDADWTPEMLVGLAPGVPKEYQFARRFAENGCRVIVPALIDRKDDYSGNAKLNKWTNQPHREFIYRMAYEMGRHIIGYEVQKVLAVVDWFCREKEHAPIAVYGYVEGALVAEITGALDERIDLVVLSGWSSGWEEPIYRNVWRKPFVGGDLFRPRSWAMEPVRDLKVDGPPTPRAGRSGAAPGRLVPLKADRPRGWFDAIHFFPGQEVPELIGELKQEGPGDERLLQRCLQELAGVKELLSSGPPPVDSRKNFDPAPRQKRQFDQLVAFTQKLMRDSEGERKKTFWAKLDTSSLEKYQASIKPLRAQLWEEVIGKLPAPTEPMNPRTRQIHDEPKWKGYEVTLDLYPDVFAYGILLVPKDLKDGEKRPVVVCQHGLEGRPQDVVNPKQRTRAYNSFGAQLADRGYIVYAPQNPYIGQDKFRVLQRKANPLGLSLFSFIVRQHERTLDWLATLPFVDPERLAFYGLSYGGKTAMRVPAILERYCLSICSGDFNEWIWKNVSYDFPGSYIFSGEYEMPEFNLGHTFNYAEMAALIAPRPFMVERGHDDPVGIDEWVAYEYAKVRRLYSKLKIPERTAIEFFAGGHEIHGVGTFEFLDKHLNWRR